MNAHCRIGRVKLHGGADLRILPSVSDKDRARIEKDFREVMDTMPEPAGYAIVTWGGSGASTAAMYVGPRSNIPSIMVGEFVRNRLLAQRIESWTIQTVNEQWCR